MWIETRKRETNNLLTLGKLLIKKQTTVKKTYRKYRGNGRMTNIQEIEHYF
jgi:hypothetical protein